MASTKARKPRVATDYDKLRLDKISAVSDVARMPTGERSGVLDDHPQFVTWLRESWSDRSDVVAKGRDGAPDRTVQHGKAKSVTVSPGQVVAVDRILRLAARRLGVGVKIVTGKEADGKVVIAFRAQTPKAGKPRKATAK